MEGNENSNVVKFPNVKSPLFNHELRQKIETGIQPFTQQPAETVERVEHIICAHLVGIARRFAESWGKSIGQKLVAKVSNE